MAIEKNALLLSSCIVIDGSSICIKNYKIKQMEQMLIKKNKIIQNLVTSF